MPPHRTRWRSQTLRRPGAVIIAIPNAFEAGQAVEQCRQLNPQLRIVARAHSDEEVRYLHDLGAEHVIMGEREIGLGMLGWANGVSGETMTAAQQAEALKAVAAALKLDAAPVPAKDEPAAALPEIDYSVAPPDVGAAPEPEPDLPDLESVAEAAPEGDEHLNHVAPSVELAQVLGALPEPTAAPKPVARPRRAKPAAPAKTAAAPFNPEVSPKTSED